MLKSVEDYRTSAIYIYMFLTFLALKKKKVNKKKGGWGGGVSVDRYLNLLVVTETAAAWPVNNGTLEVFR